MQTLGNRSEASKLPSDTPPNWRTGSSQPLDRPGTLPDLAPLATKVPRMLEKGQIRVLWAWVGGVWSWDESWGSHGPLAQVRTGHVTSRCGKKASGSKSTSLPAYVEIASCLIVLSEVNLWLYP